MAPFLVGAVAALKPARSSGLAAGSLALAAELVERALVVGIGQGEPAGEHAGVAGAMLARVKRQRSDL